MMANDGRPLFEAPPTGLWPQLFTRRDLGLLVAGDSALAEPMARAGLAAHARAGGVAELRLWGRMAAHHRDAIEEQWGAVPGAPPRLSAVWRFEPIDLMCAAEDIAEAARRCGSRTALVLMDPREPLEARLLAELEACAEVLSGG